MKLGTRISGGFAILVVLLFGIALIAWDVSHRLPRESQDVKEDIELQAFLKQAEVDHLNWLLALADYVFLDKPFTKATDSHLCDFGKWYDAYMKSDDFSGMPDSYQNLFKKLNEPHKKLHETAIEIEELVGNGDIDGARSIYNEQSHHYFNEIAQDLTQISDVIQKKVDAAKIAETNLILNVRKSIILISLVSIVASIFLGFVITRSVTNPLAKIIAIMDDISKGAGDLTQRIHFGKNQNSVKRDELAQLSALFNTFMDQLHELIFKIRQSTEEVATATDQISSTAHELAAGAEEQNSQAEAVAASAQEMSASIVQNAKSAASTAQISQKTADKAREGASVMHETRDQMKQIVTTTKKTSDTVKVLSHRAGQIGDIIQVIDDIADQTNLLALNAAIEAARAGEQGRGFAVVADEVRKLAERTTKATKEISETISAIIDDTQNAASSMDEAQGIVTVGMEVTEKTEKVLGDIIEAVKQSLNMVDQIASATEQQSSSAEEITKNVEAISSVTNQYAGASEELAATSSELSDRAEGLRKLVAAFKLNESGVI